MNHHAYFFAGDLDQGVEAAEAFGETLGLTEHHPDRITLRHALFSVQDARLVSEIASRAPIKGEAKLISIVAGRIFHEAQNALLKTFEEPPPGTFLVLIVPNEGMLLETLRSRLLPLPHTATTSISEEVKAFLSGGEAKREEIVEAFLERAKSDDPEEKQAARLAVLQFAENLTRAAYAKKGSKEMQALLSDLSRLIPVLHDRSAPLKPILEHVALIT